MLLIAVALAASVTGADIAAAGPQGPLKGTYVDAGKGAPVVLILPGSGPTDRDGNNPMGIKAAPYRLLAEGLAAQRVSTVRIAPCSGRSAPIRSWLARASVP